jgi:hypothetical protein
MRLKYLFLLFLLSSQLNAQTRLTVSGFVREAGSREALPGAHVYVPALRLGAQTNAYGFFSLVLPAGTDTATVRVTLLGYRAAVVPVTRQTAPALEVFLLASATQLSEVTVRGAADRAAEPDRMSTHTLTARQVRDVPALLGEKDVLKVFQLMPGVQKGREGSSGLYVRGGGPDQNLIILDDAVVYNAFHLFGFFSVFNGDALKSAELTKGGFPARYGGRLSSVVDMQMKEGNRERLHGEGSLGLLASRLTLEGPIQKGKSSFLVAGRRTYADLLLRPFLPRNEKFGLYFYDLNAKVNVDLGRRDRLYLSGYFGQDSYGFTNREERGGTERGGFDWGNATGTLRWNHVFSPRVFANTSAIFTRYQFRVAQEAIDDGNLFSLEYQSGVRDFSLKHDLEVRVSPRYALRAGLLATAHRFTPSAIVLKNTNLDSIGRQEQVYEAVEGTTYLENHWQPTDRLRLNAGLRLAGFWTGRRRYLRPEPRLSVAYEGPNGWSLKASYAVMNQFIHLLSNSGEGLPTDLWVPATERLGPQQARQVAVGLVRDWAERGLTLSVEAYHKTMDGVIGYREGASFLLLDVGPDPSRIVEVPWQDNVTTGQGRSSGIEWLLRKPSGRLNGWIGYTLSWTQNRLLGVNDYQWFWARYDRRHDVSVVAVYQLRPRIRLAATWIYASGQALSLPISEYELSPHTIGTGRPVSTVADFGLRGSFRADPTHRLDVAVQFQKTTRWGERTWEAGLYNAYNRINPFYYETYTPARDQSQRQLYYRGLFPLIPSVSYWFKF